MRKIFLVQLCLVLCGVSGHAVPQSARDLRVSAIQYNQKLPLVEALRVIGMHIQGGFVSFGVDISGVSEPRVDVTTPETDLVDALQRITSQLPGYTSEFVSDHVVEVYSAKDRVDPENPLNLPIRQFSVVGVPASQILSVPTRYIPELKDYLSKHHSPLGCGSIGPGLGSDALGVTLFLTGRSVRQILDAVAEADAVLPLPTANSKRVRLNPVGWVHVRKNDTKLGIVDVWSSTWFAPLNWRLYASR